jgi:RNA polymerase sigma-70 factor (ECF subfamily)
MVDIARHEVVTAPELASARAGDRDAFSALAEPYRRELQVHCYRMLGSLQDAEDLVQETLLRAWRRLDTYEGRASFRAWLYKIATNACLDALDQRARRTLPQARQSPSDPDAAPVPPMPEPIWLEPFPDDLLPGAYANLEAYYDARESITLAFLAALQALPPRQRAVLILCDVLDWRAREVAAMLGLTVSAVNSGLHRARSTLARHYHARDVRTMRTPPPDDTLHALLERYVRAWETADIEALVALLKEDITFPMPPSPGWYRGRAAVRAFVSATILAGDAHGRWRLLPTRANAQPAFAWYRREETGQAYHAFAIQVVTFEGDLIADITTFAMPGLFPFFGMPQELNSRYVKLPG